MSSRGQATPTVICLGAHVLDILVRPVEEIPAGQGGQLVDEIKMTAAGPAGGTAITLAKLGARVRSAGAVGTDPIGDMLLTLLRRAGVDTSLLLRRAESPTSASVLPIRPDGSRPAFHVIGANGAYGVEDAPWDAITAADHLHLGGPEFMGGEAAASLLSHAREHGTTTSVDILAPGEPWVLELIAAALPHIDFLLPNDEQVLGLTGAHDLSAGCAELLAAGVGCVAATAGGAGVLLAATGGTGVRVPAAATRSPPASSGASPSGPGRRRPPCSAARPPRSSRADSAATRASSTSLPSRALPPPRRP